MRSSKDKPSTSWDPVGKWYHSTVGQEGHYYHREIVLPGVLRLLDLRPKDSLLDLACGQGVLARQIPEKVFYWGVDAAPSLIKEAKSLDHNSNHHFSVGDITKPLSLDGNSFSHATIILALQNIESPIEVMKNAYKHLCDNGMLIIVLNHPCFRIPRQSSWGIDKDKKLQYRRLDSYGSSQCIPIQTHPSKAQASPATLSFHHSLANYSLWLYKTGFVIQQLEEWYSNKTSTGSAAKMENRSRKEFPLFLTIVATKIE